jgi:hypothetical protein
MNTNDLISLIIKNHCNADSLAQIASAVECLQEQLADVAVAKALMKEYIVKVFRMGGGVEYIKCLDLEDAKVTRKERIAQGGVKLALIATSEEIAELSKTFGD